MSSVDACPKTPTRSGLAPRSQAAAVNTLFAASSVSARGPSARITPTYRAPNSAAHRASSGRVMPQNLISTMARDSRNFAHRAYQLRGILRPRQRGADQHRIGAALRGALHVLDALDAALPYRDQMWRNQRHEPPRHALIDLERLEVAAVHANDVGTRFERPLQLPLVSHLDQRLELQMSCRGHQLGQIVRRQRARDQEHRRRLSGASLHQLRRIDVKVLFEQWQTNRRPDRNQVVDRA